MGDHRLDVSGGFWKWALVIGAGIFATTLPQSGNLDLPLRNLLINKFGAAQLDPCVEATGSLHTISQFFGIVALPWYFKIIVGLFSDSIPLFGTMRRHYVLLSATAAAGLWFLAGQIQHSYVSLLAIITAMESTAASANLRVRPSKPRGEKPAAANSASRALNKARGPVADGTSGSRLWRR